MSFKFVADNVGGAGTKRKQNPRSCESCKRRHKRCSHAGHQAAAVRSSPLAASPESPDSVKETPVQSRQNASSSSNWSQLDAQTQPSRPLPRPLTEARSEDGHVRFVASLSPESAFAGHRSISRHGVGLWLGQEEVQEDVSEKASPVDYQAIHVPPQVLNGFSGQTMLLSVLTPALRRECISVLPPEYELGLLSDLFYAKIDPMFPLLRDNPTEKHGDMEKVALKQCICLVASLDPSMRPHLRLPHSDAVLSQIEFRSRIAAAVKQSLDLGFITDKVVLLQVCTLMSMYVENQGFSELSTYYCAQAVLHEQTLGFHVGWPDGTAGKERSRRLFWCVFCLDRLNAATNGRPTLIHRRDMDRKVMDSIDDQPPPFKLLILIAQLLDYTISLYRPHAMVQNQGQKTDDTFEYLVETAAAHNLSNGLLASLELFYLAVVILRDRPAANQPSSELQSFCAARIVAVASGESKQALIYWPILPYSVTVAASVAYRSLRNSPMPYNRRRAYTLFNDSCGLLDDLSNAFLSARAMARLAKDTVQEVERATERTRRDSIRPTENSTRDSTTEEEEAAVDQSAIQEPHNVDRLQHPPQVAELPQQPLEAGAAIARTAGLPTAPSDPFGGPDFFNGYEGEAEIFGNFDPSFDLCRTDAIFSANLDLSVSFFGEEWPGPGQPT